MSEKKNKFALNTKNDNENEVQKLINKGGSVKQEKEIPNRAHFFLPKEIVEKVDVFRKSDISKDTRVGWIKKVLLAEFDRRERKKS